MPFAEFTYVQCSGPCRRWLRHLPSKAGGVWCTTHGLELAHRFPSWGAARVAAIEAGWLQVCTCPTETGGHFPDCLSVDDPTCLDCARKFPARAMTLT